MLGSVYPLSNLRTQNPNIGNNAITAFATRDYVSLSVFIFLFCRDFVHFVRDENSRNFSHVSIMSL